MLVASSAREMTDEQPAWATRRRYEGKRWYRGCTRSWAQSRRELHGIEEECRYRRAPRDPHSPRRASVAMQAGSEQHEVGRTDLSLQATLEADGPLDLARRYGRRRRDAASLHARLLQTGRLRRP